MAYINYVIQNVRIPNHMKIYWTIEGSSIFDSIALTACPYSILERENEVSLRSRLLTVYEQANIVNLVF